MSHGRWALAAPDTYLLTASGAGVTSDATLRCRWRCDLQKSRRGASSRGARGSTQRRDNVMKTATLAIAMALAAALVATPAYAKKKKRVVVPPAPIETSQAGGLPATNERVAALEGAVVTLRADLVAEIAARQAADAALSNQLATIPPVFVAEGFVNNLKGTTAPIVTKTVPAGTYLIMSAVQLISSQGLADAKARCVMTVRRDPAGRYLRSPVPDPDHRGRSPERRIWFDDIRAAAGLLQFQEPDYHRCRLQ